MSTRRFWALWLVGLLYLGHVKAQTPVGTSCSQLRIRKSWEAFTDEEKGLYIDAIGVAMDRGYYQKFVQIHTEQLTGLEAHQSCVFIYWHRMLLLGFENMLRSLNSSYQCITLPYWDHLAASARQASNTCASIEACSPMIADFGGATTGVSKNLMVYGTTIASSSKIFCVTQGLAFHFCGNNSGCAHCIPRTRSRYLNATTYPTEASFGSVFQQVFTSRDSGNFTTAVERGIHNAVHNALGGVMVYFQAPVDPVFYAHHALIDLLQTIYLKCQIRDEHLYLSSESKRSDPRFSTSCARSGGGNVSNSDNITMRALAYDGKTFVNVWQDPTNILYPFFKDLPYKYADYVDAKDLGNYSYTYSLSGGLANMYENCSDSNTLSAVSLLAKDREALKKWKAPLLPTIYEGTEEDDSVKLINIALFESAQILGFNDSAASEQMEMITCAHHRECIGSIDDYSDLFRANFGIKGHTRCFVIMQDIMAGKRTIGISNWREITSRFLPCPLQDEEESEEAETAIA